VFLGEEERRSLRVDEFRLVFDERGVGPLKVLGAQQRAQVLEGPFEPDFDDAVERLEIGATAGDRGVHGGIDRVALDVAFRTGCLDNAPDERAVLLEPVPPKLIGRHVLPSTQDSDKFDGHSFF
jgi:hypothetical protein